MNLAALILLCCWTSHAADHASWYGEAHRGWPMANGQRFDPDKLTAASWFYPLGTQVVVTHAGRSVVVEITDRGPAKRLVNEGRKIDLSRAAFARLANPDRGLIAVSVKKP
jgi:rare lipoprotein A